MWPIMAWAITVFDCGSRKVQASLPGGNNDKGKTRIDVIYPSYKGWFTRSYFFFFDFK
jgi:hypothetical protein